jgi:hypothetical protein
MKKSITTDGGATVIALEKAPTGLCDSNGREIHVGDRLRKEVECNEEFHGPWSIYRVKLQGLVPILTYEESEKGKVLPSGYLACALSDEYNQKLFLWATDPKELRPHVRLEVIEE